VTTEVTKPIEVTAEIKEQEIRIDLIEGKYLILII